MKRWGCWLWRVLIGAALVLATVLDVAAAGQALPDVMYVPENDELVFRVTAPAGSATLMLETPWGRQTQTELRATRDGETWMARLDVSDVPVLAELRYSWTGIPHQGEPWFTGWLRYDRPDPASDVREWQHVTGELCDVYGAQLSTAALTQIAAAGDAAVRNAQRILGDTARQVEARPRIVVVVNEWDYAMLATEGGYGVAKPSWGVTLQFLGHAEIDEFVTRTVPHEIMHLYDPTAERQDVPAWFTEGLAVLAEGKQAHTESRQLIHKAAQDETLISACWMGEYPRTEAETALWYAQALDMVEALGSEQLRALQAGMADGTQFLEVWRRVTGESAESWSAIYAQDLLGYRGRIWIRNILIGIFVVCVVLLIYREWLIRREQ